MILGIESSCDDTAMAVFDPIQARILMQATYNQITAHGRFGGIVPEIASREHLHHFPRLISELTAVYPLKNYTALSVTCRPGLIGSLLVGVSYARALAYALKLPLWGIDHLEAHIFSVFVDKSAPKFPFLSLLISGGHTQIYAVWALQNYQILGQTLDDALGEAFDKIAKMLGLTYPGGPELEKLALAFQGQVVPIKFPLPLRGQAGCDFSFSGLKTFALHKINELGLERPRELYPYVLWQEQYPQSVQQKAASVALGFQNLIAEFLTERLARAVKQTGIREIAICGGVAQNKFLQKALERLAALEGWSFIKPAPSYIADNGAMVAYLAYLYQSQSLSPSAFQPSSNSPLGRRLR